jgi:hypothetical protein
MPAMDGGTATGGELQAEVDRYPWYHTLELGNGV